MKHLTIPFFLFLFPLLANAYTWQFTSQPRQCQNLSLAVQGSGQPPYSLLIIPSGPSPFANNTEVRTIQNISFSGTSTTLSFKLNFPENSSFVAVVSDSNSFGSGGTSTPVTVLQSSDSSCYDASHSVQGPWVFSIDPTGGITQCESVRWWWEQSFVNGTVNLLGVIPGGNSFAIPQGPLSTNNNTGTGFNWTVDIAGGTNILVVAVIIRALDPAVALHSLPAGGSYPTSTSGTSTGNSGGNHSNTGAIVGGVVGAVIGFVAIGLLALFFFRRRQYSAISKERPVNVLQDDEDDNAPFLVPDPTIGGTSDAASTHTRPLSMTPADIIRPQTPASMATGTTTTRKTGAPSQLRPRGSGGNGEPELIELPPAYTNIRSAQRLPATADSPTADAAATPTSAPAETNP
ncbi:hypothetical protein B0F90DRAFT_1818532 [Multifurca ochricompacta]|uniref:Uncharacterized protein n=1 Tax=Multifurca ochricompacta TaxID=376703 RepID=A0AAD4QME0_9AGAM|nr:hypothetical protein B0F90DRAFT_1818532 [Multifurca ochricompacta]